ncbi:MAG TPA: glycosyl transferase family 90 [Rhabdochlamydiaceae bacterium]|nr:glycosyl transferase family 90 [Rhabdochlamydiaceae bacterium]
MVKNLLLSIGIVICLLGLLAHQNKWQTKLAGKINTGEVPLWMLEQISEDLKVFSSSGITTEMLDQIISETNQDNHYGLARFQIKNGKLQVKFAEKIDKARRFRTIKKALDALCKHTKLPDVDFIVTIQDASPFTDLKGPLFAFAKDRYLEKNVILIPDDGAFRGNTSWLSKVAKGRKSYPWEQKENRVFWRGATTGGCATLSTFNELPRSKLVKLSLQFPELVDAKFNHLAQMNEETMQKLTELGYKGESISVIDHLKYKYQILIDGNTCAYTRAFWQLCSDCVMFKQNSDNIQWFYRALAPDVHYIPIQNDMSDLIEKVEWAKAHDQEVQKIVHNANLFAKHNLQIEDVHLYFYLLLCEYAKIQK